MNNQGNVTQKIRLRRNRTKQEIIKQNLTMLQENKMKKKMAQDRYYMERGIGQSPLKRNNGRKPPVQNRLGGVQQQSNQLITTNRLRTNQFNTANRPQTNRVLNTNNRLPNNRLINRNQLQNNQGVVRMRNTVLNNKNKRFINRQSVQTRITNIRQHNNANKQKKTIGLRSQQNLEIRTVGKINQIQMRRPANNNFKIQVPNMQGQNNQNQSVNKTTFTLNPTLQAEIKAIQKKNTRNGIAPDIVLDASIGFTGVSLNDRFSQLIQQ